MSVIIPLDPDAPYIYQNPDQASIVGSGQILSDGSDATYATVTGIVGGSGTVSGSIAAALPQVDVTNLTDLGFSARAVIASSFGRTSAQVAFYIGGAMSTFPSGWEEAPPPVNSTVTDLYYPTWGGLGPTGSTVEALSSGTANMVFALPGAQVGETLTATLYEFAWLLTYSEAPPTGHPVPYRARQRLHPIAPARRWPREAWQGSSSRRVGGYR